VGVSLVALLLALENLSMGACKKNPFSFTKHWLRLLKVLVEQGDPFTDTLLKQSPIRLTVVGFLLVGIVLSNAYKNSNVYNMIAPRQSVPYRLLEELLQDNFTIYVRSYAVRVLWNKNILPNSSNEVKISVEKHNLGYNGGWMFTKGAIAWAHSELVGLIIQLQYLAFASKLHEKSLFQLSQIKNRSDLHPYLVATFKKRIESLLRLKPPPFYSNDMENWFQDTFNKEEMKLLDEFMEHCNRTALILPHGGCMQNAMHLRRKGYQNVYVGEETFVKYIRVFSITGRIPPFVIKRLGGMQASGIWEWWLTILQRRAIINDAQSGTVVRAPNLEGNILVIFAILGIGFVAGWLCYLIENLKRVYPVVKLVFKFNVIPMCRMFVKRLGGMCYKNSERY